MMALEYTDKKNCVVRQLKKRINYRFIMNQSNYSHFNLMFAKDFENDTAWVIN